MEELRRALGALQQWIGCADTAMRLRDKESLEALQVAGMNAGKTIVTISPDVRRVLAAILDDIHAKADVLPPSTFAAPAPATKEGA